MPNLSKTMAVNSIRAVSSPTRVNSRGSSKNGQRLNMAAVIPSPKVTTAELLNIEENDEKTTIENPKKTIIPKHLINKEIAKHIAIA